MTIALGIDLGTTYTVAALIKDGRAHVIPNAEGQPLTPSVVAFTPQGKPLVGQLARRQAAANAERTVRSIKRYMGSDHKVRIGEKEFTPQEISSLILKKVRADVESYVGGKIDRAVITVPAYFNDRQRQATKRAGLLAGLDVIRIINEPTAAALAYGVDQEDIHTVLVWDLGGGTFDVSILALGQGIFEVRSVSGDTWLGGDDYDSRLIDYLVRECRAQLGIELRPDDGAAWQKLKEVAEKAKIELSTASATQVRFRVNGSGQNNSRQFEMTLAREEFQELTADLVERMIVPTRQALADAGLEPHHIDRVILVGGATRMPAVREKARELLGKEPYRYVDPDQVVAIGAAIQAGVLLGLVKKAALLDVIPLSLGIETQGGLFTRIIPRNTPLPASEGRIFTTAADNQDSVDIHVLQGERELALHNISLGKFQLQGIPPLRRGTPRIEVSFDVDVDGIVHVSATDLLTDAEENIKLVSSKTLHPDEVERMISEAGSLADEDRSYREGVETGIVADNVICAAENALEQLADQGLGAKVDELERAVLRVKEALASGINSETRARSDDLRDLLRVICEGREYRIAP